jgi:hypothetical protein
MSLTNTLFIEKVGAQFPSRSIYYLYVFIAKPSEIFPRMLAPDSAAK